MTEFFDQNARERPLLIEQNLSFLREFSLAERLVPDKNLLLRYRPQDENPVSKPINPGKGFGEFKQWLEEELAVPGIQNESRWILKVSYFIPSFAAYFHSAGYYKEEREALMVMYEFLGQRGPGWHLKMVDNLTLDGKPEEARKKLEPMRKHFPEFFATHLATGRVLQSEGNYADAIQSFDRALEVDPEAFRPHLEKSLAWLGSGNKEKTISTLIVARKKIKTLNDLKQLENVEKIIE
jgi:tetratricopeptide (TPR) repeat protein